MNLNNHQPIPYIYDNPHLLNQSSDKGGNDTLGKWHLEYGGWEVRLMETRRNLRLSASRGDVTESFSSKEAKGEGRKVTV